MIGFNLMQALTVADAASTIRHRILPVHIFMLIFLASWLVLSVVVIILAVVQAHVGDDAEE